jgi:hypothetical protein
MYPSVIQVTAQEDFLLQLKFDNGEQRVLNMKPFLGFGVFGKLQDKQLFNSVHIAFDTIEWDEGIDLDPAFVYAKSLSLVPQNGENSYT